MDSSCQDSDLNAKYLLSQLNIARKEISNLRQQIKSLRYIHEKEVDNIKKLLELKTNTISDSTVISSEEEKPSTSTEDDILKLKPIGVISTWFPNKRGTPRQTRICKRTPGRLTLNNSVFTNPDHALEGLQDFSHMWILFHFHKNDSTHVRAKVAPPRLNGLRTGVFSTRSPHRPCPIGLSLVKIIRIENYTIYFEGVDMVDQSPVLDIKPYIPQYDSPLHIEKLNNHLTDQSELNTNNRLEQTENSDDLNEHTFQSLEAEMDSDDELRRDSVETYCRDNSAEVHTDISRDEEIALRLQAEEFQRNTNLENYLQDSSQFSDVNEDSPMPTDVDAILRFARNGSINERSIFNSSNRRVTLSSIIDSHSENIRNLSDRLENIELDDQDNYDSLHMIDDSLPTYAEPQIPRNSRLLDGADGPNTVCGTDVDFIQRRVLNSRIDNSPVRMGVREAPDGEEGFQSQTVTPSQTFSNIQGAQSPSDSNLLEGIDTNETDAAEDVITQNSGFDINSSEVRIPDWISRSYVTTLSVIFNDRALMQLNEILQDKAEEQKHAIENVLREDPRSVYLRQRWGNQFYTFLIHDLHITCKFDDSRGIVTVFQVRHAGRTCECGEPEWQCLGHSPLS